MTLKNPNPLPRFANNLEKILTQAHEKFIIVDIGSRNGIEKDWQPLHKLANIIGFEADPGEASRLNAENEKSSINIHHYPYALSDIDGTREFYVTNFAQSSGFYEQNPNWVKRFPITEQDVVKKILLNTITLDSFVKKEALTHIDFIKIDVEGAELDILKGAHDSLQNRHVLGIKTEFWWDPEIKQAGQPSFAELDTYIRGHGFKFFDLNLHYYPRNSVPSGRITGQFDNPEAKERLKYRQLEYGQAWTGDAIYFRDPVGEHINNQEFNSETWSTGRLLRLCALLDIYDYGDAAIEILDYFRKRISKHLSLDIDKLYDLLTPMIDGRELPYGEFLKLSQTVRQEYRKRALGLEDWIPPVSKYNQKT